MDKIKILIVEDDRILNEFFYQFFQIYFKNNILQAYDGVEALELYKTHNPDIIFTDINLPKLDGLSLIEKVRKFDKKTQVIVASSHFEQDKLLKAIELNLIAYLIKPIDQNKLQATINSIKKVFKTESIVKISQSYSFNILTSQLFDENREVKLTVKEKKVLQLLVENKNRCVTYEEISSFIYDYEEYSLNAISSLIKRLRKKIKDPIIDICYNEGYKIQLYYSTV
jgi:DNA-binding response OmpR family regulator